MKVSRSLGRILLTFWVGLMLPSEVLADEPVVRTQAPRPTTTTTTTAVQAASAGPGGLSALVDVQMSRTTSDSGADPRRIPTSPTIPTKPTGDSLLASLAVRACTAAQDTWVWEVAANAPNGFWCGAGPTTSGGSNGGGDGSGLSLEGEARARIKSVPWPNLVIETNPVTAIVAVPTYYWIRSYRGDPVQAHANVTIPDGQTCHDVTDEDGNTIGQDCTPKTITYAMTITATPTSYLVSWDDVRTNPRYRQVPGTHDLPLPSPLGLGIPYEPPAWPESPVVHVFEDSSYYRGPAGYSVTLTISYVLTWEAIAPGGRHQGGALGDWSQTAALHQHVQEIQVLHCLPEIRNSCP